MKKFIAAFMVVALTLIASASFALAKEGPEKLAIAGPGLKDVVEVTDPTLTDGLNPWEFIWRGRGDLKLPKVGDGYELTAFEKEDGQFKPFNRLRYHLNPSGGIGYVYYIGAGEFGRASNDDGKWFCASTVSDAAMRRLLRHLNVALPTVTSAQSPDKFTLKGPGLQGEIQLKSLEVDHALEQLTYHGWGHVAVPKVSNGYALTRYTQDCTGQYITALHLRYYPGGGGRPGYVYESEMADDNLDKADNWFFTTLQGEAAMQALLKKASVPTSAVQPSASAITLDALPTQIIAGQAVTIGFSMQYSTSDPRLPDTLIVYAQHVEEGARTVFIAKADSAYGHYKATLEFPRGGTWYWLINAERPNGEQPMPILQVTGADGRSTSGRPAASPNDTQSFSPLLISLGLLGLLAIVGIVFARFNGRSEA